MLVSHFQSWLVSIASALFHVLFYLWNLVENLTMVQQIKFLFPDRIRMTQHTFLYLTSLSKLIRCYRMQSVAEKITVHRPQQVLIQERDRGVGVDSAVRLSA